VPYSNGGQTSEGRADRFATAANRRREKVGDTTGKTNVFLFRARGQRGFNLVEAFIAVILLIAIPTFLSPRRHAGGSACNGQLDSIYSAKEQLAFKAGTGPGSATIPLDANAVNSYLRGTDMRKLCPAGGRYIVGDINAPDGTIIVPVCTNADAGAGGGITREQRGLCIHRRAFVQDASGVYRRRADRTFADEVERLEKDSK
jgi:hypothetical protein